MKFAIIIPVYNEAPTLEKVLKKLSVYKDGDVVIVDDGSNDATPSILERLTVKAAIRHSRNEGYGKSLIDGFEFAKNNGYPYCVTMDADEQHEPEYIPRFLEKLDQYDIVSGSRYLDPALSEGQPPAERLQVNRVITEKLKPLTGYNLTDSFCGFKGYRVEGLRKLRLTETNYGFPIQFWLQAAKAGLSFTEIAVPLIYKDHSRNFNNQFANRDERLDHYLRIMESETKGLTRKSPLPVRNS
ncbi:MAG TPA: glycosyltransferase family 2 protein [bacterium]|nr:glycosyltransferase family 2 protein [bacterium]